jgi:hypothetical protein
MESCQPRLNRNKFNRNSAEQQVRRRAKLDIALTAKPREVCGETLSITRAKRTGQSFGDMKVGKSMAYQGIVGTAQSGKLTATDGITTAQGQMDATSFAMMFGRP